MGGAVPSWDSWTWLPPSKNCSISPPVQIPFFSNIGGPRAPSGPVLAGHWTRTSPPNRQESAFEIQSRYQAQNFPVQIGWGEGVSPIVLESARGAIPAPHNRLPPGRQVNRNLSDCPINRFLSHGTFVGVFMPGFPPPPPPPENLISKDIVACRAAPPGPTGEGRPPRPSKALTAIPLESNGRGPLWVEGRPITKGLLLQDLFPPNWPNRGRSLLREVVIQPSRGRRIGFSAEGNFQKSAVLFSNLSRKDQNSARVLGLKVGGERGG